MASIALQILALLLSVNLARATTLATDAFTGTANPLGGSWTTISGGLGDLQKLTDVVRGTSIAARNGARYTGVATPDDGYAQMSITTFAASASAKSATITYRTAAAAETYYGCSVYGSGGLGTLAIDLVYIAAGAYTSLQFVPSVTVNANSVLKITATGTAIKCLVDGVEVASAIHATLTAGQAGIVTNTPDAVADVQVDNFEVGDFAVVATKKKTPIMVYQ